MGGDALEDLLFGKLDYSASITDRMLNISIWDLTPEAYMDRFGFSQVEKDWACAALLRHGGEPAGVHR